MKNVAYIISVVFTFHSHTVQCTWREIKWNVPIDDFWWSMKKFLGKERLSCASIFSMTDDRTWVKVILFFSSKVIQAYLFFLWYSIEWITKATRKKKKEKLLTLDLKIGRIQHTYKSNLVDAN